MQKNEAIEVKKAVFKVLDYFEFFSYGPSFEQIHTFLSIKVPKKVLKDVLVELEKQGKIQHPKYVHTGIGIYRKPDGKANSVNQAKKMKYSKEKIRLLDTWLKCMELLPWCYFVGLSGSCAMNNAQKGDDIDVCIISAPGGMWICRISAIFFAKVLGIHRSRRTRNVSNKLCLNLFFDMNDIAVPTFKQNVYSAHEVVQMAPLYIRGGAYDNFLSTNRWIGRFFPNFHIPKPTPMRITPITAFMIKLADFPAKLLQKAIMRKDRKNEIITDTQLWFFPDDFTKKIERHIDIEV